MHSWRIFSVTPAFNWNAHDGVVDGVSTTGVYISGDWCLYLWGVIVWVWVPTGMASCWRGVEIDGEAGEAPQWLLLSCGAAGQSWDDAWFCSGFCSLSTWELCKLTRNEGCLWSDQRAVRCSCESVRSQQWGTRSTCWWVRVDNAVDLVDPTWATVLSRGCYNGKFKPRFFITWWSRHPDQRGYRITWLIYEMIIFVIAIKHNYFFNLYCCLFLVQVVNMVIILLLLT